MLKYTNFLHWLLTVVWLMPGSSYAQNDLVPNGGFDDITSCPTVSGLLHLALPWTNTVAGSPDLYNECSNGNVSLPVNPGGFQETRSGSGFAGFHAFNYGNGREFLQVELLHPMVYGTSYQVQFYVNLRDDSKYSVSTLGAYLSDTLITREDYSIHNLNIEPQILNSSPEPFSDKENWMLVCDTFSSRFGREQYLIIGNFYLDEESDTTLLETGFQYGSYYYIDDVSVLALNDSVPNGVGEVSNEKNGFSVYPNPNNGRMTVNYSLTEGEKGTLSIYSTLGELVFQRSLSNETNQVEVDVMNFSSGIYLLNIDVNKERKLIERLSIMRE